LKFSYFDGKASVTNVQRNLLSETVTVLSTPDRMIQLLTSVFCTVFISVKRGRVRISMVTGTGIAKFV